MRYAICDNCGCKDDTAYEANHPVLAGGVLLQFRSESGDELEDELELCEKCREVLLETFPKLQRAIEGKAE